MYADVPPLMGLLLKAPSRAIEGLSGWRGQISWTDDALVCDERQLIGSRCADTAVSAPDGYQCQTGIADMELAGG